MRGCSFLGGSFIGGSTVNPDDYECGHFNKINKDGWLVIRGMLSYFSCVLEALGDPLQAGILASSPRHELQTIVLLLPPLNFPMQLQ